MIINKLVLNEVFLAEKDASKTSTYKLQIDDKDMGQFKSSGVICSTGTGSSGWLYGAKRVTSGTVAQIANEILERGKSMKGEKENLK